jgi:hypothetical protein
VAAESYQPAALFGLPGITREISNRENNDGLATTLSQSSSVDAVGLIPLKQTDVITHWDLRVEEAGTFTANGDTMTASEYFPWNLIRTIKLNMQNQYSTIDTTGIDLAILNSYRPAVRNDYPDVNFGSAGSMYSAQSNLVSASNYTTASTTMNLPFQVPASITFDEYFPLADDGTILSQLPMADTIVSPQYMAGTSRIVTPQVTYNQGIGSTSDNGLITSSGSNATFTAATATQRWLRHGFYQPQGAADSPPVHDWQYTFKSQSFSLSGLSAANLNVPLNGQVLSVMVRLYDPAANSSKGGTISVSNVTECDLVYGSGLYRFQHRPHETQRRFLAQHKFLPTKGTLIWDLAQQKNGKISNRGAMNTMNTSGIQVQLTFSGTQSSSAYAVVSVEAITYVQA